MKNEAYSVNDSTTTTTRAVDQSKNRTSDIDGEMLNLGCGRTHPNHGFGHLTYHIIQSLHRSARTIYVHGVWPDGVSIQLESSLDTHELSARAVVINGGRRDGHKRRRTALAGPQFVVHQPLADV